MWPGPLPGTVWPLLPSWHQVAPAPFLAPCGPAPCPLPGIAD